MSHYESFPIAFAMSLKLFMLSSPDCILTLSDRVMWVLDIFQRLLSFWIRALTRRLVFILYDVGASLALKK